MIFWNLLNNFQINITYENGLFYGNRENLTELFYFYDKIGGIAYFGGYFFIIFSFERIVKKTKYSLSITSATIIVVYTIFPVSLLGILVVIFVFIVIIIFFFIMIALAKWSRLEFKAIAIIMINGIGIMPLGLILDTPEILSLNLIPLYVAPVIYIIGGLIFVSPTVINPKFFTNALNYWYVLGIIVICNLISMTIFALIFLGFEFKLMYPISSVIGIFFVLRTINDIKAQLSENLIAGEKEVSKPSVDLSKMFSKPQSITEEEVMVHREKKICLVCKGSVLRYNSYICECNALYCENCAKRLEDLENACWVCNTPFNELKATTPYKKEEEALDIEISEKTTKQKIDKDLPNKK